MICNVVYICIPNKRKNHPFTSPSQTWYKVSHRYGPSHKEDGSTPTGQRPNPSDSLHPTLALLGMAPSSIHNDIESLSGLKDATPRTSNTHPMSEIILRTTLKLHKKDNAFKKWMEQRSRWDG